MLFCAHSPRVVLYSAASYQTTGQSTRDETRPTTARNHTVDDTQSIADVHRTVPSSGTMLSLGRTEEDVTVRHSDARASRAVLYSSA